MMLLLGSGCLAASEVRERDTTVVSTRIVERDTGERQRTLEVVEQRGTFLRARVVDLHLCTRTRVERLASSVTVRREVDGLPLAVLYGFGVAAAGAGIAGLVEADAVAGLETPGGAPLGSTAAYAIGGGLLGVGSVLLLSATGSSVNAIDGVEDGGLDDRHTTLGSTRCGSTAVPGVEVDPDT